MKNLWNAICDHFGKRQLNSLGDGINAIKRKYGMKNAERKITPFDSDREYVNKKGDHLIFSSYSDPVRRYKYNDDEVKTVNHIYCDFTKRKVKNDTNVVERVMRQKICYTNTKTGVSTMSRFTDIIHPQRKNDDAVLKGGRENSFRGFGKTYNRPDLFNI